MTLHLVEHLHPFDHVDKRQALGSGDYNSRINLKVLHLRQRQVNVPGACKNDISR
jgi:hypothetical protein